MKRITTFCVATVMTAVILTGCGTKEKNDENKIETVDAVEAMYQGFIPIESEDLVTSYTMDDYYIITNEDDWQEWQSKYSVYACNYYLEDLDFNWDTDCMITYAYCGARGTITSIAVPKSIDFTKDGEITMEFLNPPVNNVFCLSNSDNTYIAYQAIKYKKADLPENVKDEYYTYRTLSME